MKEVLKYFRDPRFFLPAGFLIGFEIFLQSGLYRPLMQPRSYADNVLRVVETASNSRVDPNVLIIGTSVAYQGINLPYLNKLLEKKGLRIQSGACEGAQMETQHLLYKALETKMPHLKLILHVSDISFPWTARFTLDQPNRSMIAQFPRRMALPLLMDYGFHVSSQDWIYFFIRSVTYQKDLRDFVTDPLDRIKGIGRRMREVPSDYVYENTMDYQLAAYPSKNLHECIQTALRGIPESDASGRRITDHHHQKAVWQTCQVGLIDPFYAPGAAQWNRLYFERLKKMYDEMYARGLTVATIFPPYSDLIQDFNENTRYDVWASNLKDLHGNRSYELIDLRYSANSRDLYYDTIHLNRAGSMKFTEAVADAVMKKLPVLIPGEANSP